MTSVVVLTGSDLAGMARTQLVKLDAYRVLVADPGFPLEDYVAEVEAYRVPGVDRSDLHTPLYLAGLPCQSVEEIAAGLRELAGAR